MYDKDLKYRISLEDYFSQGIKDAESHATVFEHTVNGLKSTIAGLAGIAISFEGLKGMAEAFIEDEKVAQQLRFTVGARGGLAADFEDLHEKAMKFQETGMFSNDDIEKGQQSLLNYGISLKGVKDHMKTILDVAAVKGKGIDDVVGAVSMASAGGRAMALKEFGLGFLKLEKDMSVAGAEARNFNKIIAAMQERFSGGLEDITKNTEFGKMENLKFQFDEFRKDVGKGLLGLFNMALPSLKEFISNLREMVKWMGEHKKMIREIALAATTLAVAYGTYKGILAATIAYEEIAAFVTGVKLVSALTGATASQMAFNLVASINPYVAAIAGAAALVLILDKLVNKENEWRNTILDENHKRYEEHQKAVDKEVQAIEELAVSYKNLSREKQLAAAEHSIQSKLQDEYTEAAAKYGATSQQARDLMKKMQLITEASNKGYHKNYLEGKSSLQTNALGSELSGPEASKITNVTINFGDLFPNMKNNFATMEMGIDGFMNKLEQALNTVVTDAAIIATE